MFADESVLNQLRTKLSKFPLVQRFLAPSLGKRIRTDHWYENRVIRYIVREAKWVERLEREFSEAQLNTIANSEEIVGMLTGTETGYDQQLFDAITEVRLARWARSQGYQDIEKLKRGEEATPDFLMKRQNQVVLAEAKHFQVRDYLLYFVEDRIEGLALKTRRLTRFGLQVETGSEYDKKRDAVMQDRHVWLESARNELTERWLSSLEQCLMSNAGARINILGGLFEVARSETVGSGRVSSTLAGTLDPRKTVMLCLSKLQRKLIEGLGQIKKLMDTKETGATQAIVFFSGIDQWEPEWGVLWSTLKVEGEQWAWDCVRSIWVAADALINMPFELIVGRYKEEGTGVEYTPFPWKPEDLQF